MCVQKNVVERTRDQIYLKFVATVFFQPQCWRKFQYFSVALAIHQIVLIIRHFATPTTSLRINTSLVSSGQTLAQAAPLEINTSLLQHFTAESSRELRRNAVPSGS